MGTRPLRDLQQQSRLFFGIEVALLEGDALKNTRVRKRAVWRLFVWGVKITIDYSGVPIDEENFFGLAFDEGESLRVDRLHLFLFIHLLAIVTRRPDNMCSLEGLLIPTREKVDR